MFEQTHLFSTSGKCQDCIKRSHFLHSQSCSFKAFIICASLYRTSVLIYECVVWWMIFVHICKLEFVLIVFGCRLCLLRNQYCSCTKKCVTMWHYYFKNIFVEPGSRSKPIVNDSVSKAFHIFFLLFVVVLIFLWRQFFLVISPF